MEGTPFQSQYGPLQAGWSAAMTLKHGLVKDHVRSQQVKCDNELGDGEFPSTTEVPLTVWHTNTVIHTQPQCYHELIWTNVPKYRGRTKRVWFSEGNYGKSTKPTIYANQNTRCGYRRLVRLHNYIEGIMISVTVLVTTDRSKTSAKNNSKRSGTIMGSAEHNCWMAEKSTVPLPEF